MSLQKGLVAIAAATVALSSAPVWADITFGAGGGTYKYDSFYNGTGTPVADPNATASSNMVYSQDSGGAYYSGQSYFTYNSASGDTPATLTYTFDAAPGQVFTGGTVTAEFTLFAQDAEWDETVTTNLNSTPVKVDGLTGTDANGSGSPFSGQSYSYNTESLTSAIAGSDTFTITEDVYAGGYANQYQLFREDTDGNGTGNDTSPLPFVVTATSTAAVPEPATVGLLTASGAGLLLRRRRRLAR